MPAGWDWVRWGCGEWQRNFLSPQYAIVMWWLVKICQASLLVSAIVCQLELSLSRVGTLGQKLAPVGLKKKKSKQVYGRLKEKLPKLVGMGGGEEEKCVLVLLMMLILLHNFGSECFWQSEAACSWVQIKFLIPAVFFFSLIWNVVVNEDSWNTDFLVL